MALSKTAIPASIRPQVRQQGQVPGRLPDHLSGQEPRVSRAGAFPAKPFLVTGQTALSAQNPRLAARVDVMAAIKANAVNLPQEPEDAKLTGVTRSLNRRLLGLNLGGSLLRPA